MTPSQQRLGSDEASVGETDDWLVRNVQLSGTQGQPEAILDRELLPNLESHGGIVKAVLARSGTFRMGQCWVSVADKGRRGCTSYGSVLQRDSEAGRHPEETPVDVDVCLEERSYALLCHRRGRAVDDKGRHYGELV